jgi:CubicO group peptidase (beta-lactamase class C family)
VTGVGGPRHDGEWATGVGADPFVLGSASKGFTALAVMQLLNTGLVDLDTPVRRYVPELTTRTGTGGQRHHRAPDTRLPRQHPPGHGRYLGMYLRGV